MWLGYVALLLPLALIAVLVLSFKPPSEKRRALGPREQPSREKARWQFVAAILAALPLWLMPLRSRAQRNVGLAKHPLTTATDSASGEGRAFHSAHNRQSRAATPRARPHAVSHGRA
jgi:hypothetical protein